MACTLLILFSWAGQTVFYKHAELIDEKVCSLSSGWWNRLSSAIHFRTNGLFLEKRDIQIRLKATPPLLSERALVALSARTNDQASDRLFQERLKNYNGDDRAVLEFCQRSALRAALQNPTTWQNWLPIISQSYAKGVVSDPYYGYRFAHAIHTQNLPPKIAEDIMEHCESYPTELVALAEQSCRQRVAEKVTPVGTVAEKEDWFQL